MAGPATILREIHRLRRHARDLQTEIERGPRALKAQQLKVTKQEEAWHQVQEALKKFKVAISEKEGTLRAKNQQIAKYEKQRNEATSKKEYDALQSEIDADKRACRKLEDEILEVMGENENQAIRLPEIEQAVQRAKEEVLQFEKTQQDRQVGLTEQLGQVLQQLTEIETTLPEDIRPAYARLVAAMGEDAMSSAQNRTCSACYTEITAQNYNELIQSRFVLCKNCGRFLYLPG